MSADSSIEDVLEGRARWCCVHGDCLDVMRAMPDRSVAHVITDPPYSERVHAGIGAEGRSDGFNVREAITFGAMSGPWAALLGAEWGRISTRWALAFGDEWSSGYWLACGLPFVRGGVWRKIGSMPQMSGDRPASGVDYISIMHSPKPKGAGAMRWNGGGRHAVWECVIAKGAAREGGHSTPKPLDLMLALVADFTDPDDLILDPFAGSGTTGVAALRLGRRVILIEKDAKYAALCRERMQDEEQGSTLKAARAGQLPLLG
jgi:site-specific DNA-methyltransferase (adenine-specific)